METRTTDQCAPAANNRFKRKIWAYFYMPILYILIVSLLFMAVIAPYKSAVLSWIGTFSSPVTYDNTTLTSIYKGYTQPEPTEEPVDPDAEETISCRLVEVPYYNTEYARLTCEALGVDCALYFGDSTAALKKGAGQYAGSYLPGYNGHILVCAHNTSYFKPLEHVEIGQVFTINTNYGIYQYEVYETKVLDHKDDSAYDFSHRDEEVLILYTCYPFYRMSSVKTDRLFVFCKKISGPRVLNE